MIGVIQMNMHKILLENLVLFTLLTSMLFVSTGASANDDFNATDIRKAIEKSLPYLEKDGIAWMEGRIPIQNGSACVSCHQVPFGIWSQNEAKSRGIRRYEHLRE